MGILREREGRNIKPLFRFSLISIIVIAGDKMVGLGHGIGSEGLGI